MYRAWKRILYGCVGINTLLVLFFLAVPGFSRAMSEIETIIERQKTIGTLSADFVQKKHSSMLKDPLISKGSFHFKAPGKVAWIYDDQIEIISNGKDLTVYYPQIGEAEIVPVKNSIIRLPLDFNLVELQRYFILHASKNKGNFVVTLSPVDESSLFSKMVITLLPSGVPERVEMFEKSGDRSVITFTKQRVNEELSDELFNKKLPEGTVIRRHQQ